MLKPMAADNGFTLIELIVAITIVSILTLTASPALSSWVANAQVRTAADGIQNALHLAQAEAARRNRGVQLVLTDSDPSSTTGPWTASATGKNWVIVTVPITALGESVERVQGASTAAFGPLVSIAGPATLTFNSLGLVSGAAGISTYVVQRTAADHPLNVTVSVGGQIRSCDKSKSIATSPEGCA